MILLKRNIDLKITNEELEYGMGFLLEKGIKNAVSKLYVGHKIGPGEFCFEDKVSASGMWIGFSHINFGGYAIKNVSGEYLVLNLLLSKKHLSYLVLLLSLLNIAPLLGSLVVHSGNYFFLFIVPGISIILLLLLWLNLLADFSTTRKEVKKQIETRLRVREYHRQKNQ